MNNWPFPRQPNRHPFLGPIALIGAVILAPLIVVLMAFFGIVVWGLWTDGSMGKAVAVFMVIGLAVILYAVFTVFRRL